MAKISVSGGDSRLVYVCLEIGVNFNDVINAIESKNIDVQLFQRSDPGTPNVLVCKKKVK